MPPKVKFTKDEIIQAALNVARVKGASSVSTRDIAAELQVSTRPIFTYFIPWRRYALKSAKRRRSFMSGMCSAAWLNPFPFWA